MLVKEAKERMAVLDKMRDAAVAEVESAKTQPEKELGARKLQEVIAARGKYFEVVMNDIERNLDHIEKGIEQLEKKAAMSQ